METDALSDMRSAVLGRTGGRTSVIQTAKPGTENIVGNRPGEPGYSSRVPPPDEPGLGAEFIIDPLTKQMIAVSPEDRAAIVEMTSMAPVSPTATPRTQAGPRPTQRIVVSFGPQPGRWVIGIEEAPDWDMEFSLVVNEASVQDLLPILRKLARIKDLTGGRLPPEHRNVPSLGDIDEYFRAKDPEAAPAGDGACEAGSPEAAEGGIPFRRGRGRGASDGLSSFGADPLRADWAGGDQGES